MLKLKAFLLITFCFFLFEATMFESYVYAASGDVDASLDTELLAKKRQKKRRRKKKRRKKRRRKRRKNRRRVVRSSYVSSSREFKKGFYLNGGIGYFMPSKVDFQPVIDAGSSSASIHNAELVYDAGAGVNLGAGYRFLKYFGTEGQLFLVYPLVGSTLTISRDESEGKSAGAKMVMAKLLLKGILPMDVIFGSSPPIDLYASLGMGYTQVLKTVDPEDEGVALAGMSFHGIFGLDYDMSSSWGVGGSFEYASISYTYVDLWDESIYDSTADESVSLSQTMMIFTIYGIYRF